MNIDVWDKRSKVQTGNHTEGGGMQYSTCIFNSEFLVYGCKYLSYCQQPLCHLLPAVKFLSLLFLLQYVCNSCRVVRLTASPRWTMQWRRVIWLCLSDRRALAFTRYSTLTQNDTTTTWEPQLPHLTPHLHLQCTQWRRRHGCFLRCLISPRTLDINLQPTLTPLLTLILFRIRLTICRSHMLEHIMGLIQLRVMQTVFLIRAILRHIMVPFVLRWTMASAC